MPETTVILVNQNRKDMLRLTVETFRIHNADVRFVLWIWDNNSIDGSREWALENCDRLWTPTGSMGHHHAVPLDRMIPEVDTPFVMTLDNDVISSGPVLKRMIDELHATGAYTCSIPLSTDMGQVEHRGVMLQGQPRIDPYCALYRTPDLARMVEHVSFSPAEAVNIGKFYDTGSMLTQTAKAAGLRIAEVPWIKENTNHLGAMTWGHHAPEGSPIRRAIDHKDKVVKSSLEALHASLNNDTEIVVAKYKEDVSWTAGLKHRVTIYDKSDLIDDGALRLDNVGREAHTFAHHVATRYDTLSSVTVFTQGNPFDHVPDFLSEVEDPTAYFRLFGKTRMTTGPQGDPSHSLPSAQFYRRITGRSFPELTVFAPGAIFAAHRSVLQHYPQSWWRRLTDMLAEPETQTYAPWIMERIWKLLLADPGHHHHYHNIAGWFDYQRLYRDTVEAATDGMHFVEIGAWHGKSTSFLATEILNSGKRIRLDVVDHFMGSDSPDEEFMRIEAANTGGTVRPVFDFNTQSVSSVFNVIQKSSLDAAKDYDDRSLDFVFIDAGHTYADVTADIEAWLPKVKVGGQLCGHDHSVAWPGVVKAVKDKFGDNYDPVDCQCWRHVVS